MTSKRKQQTVQFLFEASPENNITRCVISSTRSNAFEDSEGWNRPGNGRSAQITADEGSTDTIGNNKGLGQNAITENDGDYMKARDEHGKTYTEKVIKLRNFFQHQLCYTCMRTWGIYKHT